jgi:hypothetical protein
MLNVITLLGIFYFVNESQYYFGVIKFVQYFTNSVTPAFSFRNTVSNMRHLFTKCDISTVKANKNKKLIFEETALVKV